MADEEIRPADLPAGHARDEARRKVKDKLEQKIDENMAADGIEAIDKSKFEHIDNEIGRYASLRKPDGGTGMDIDSPKPGYRYARLTVADGYGQSARANIRSMHEWAKKFGYEPVQGDDPEDTRFRGNDCASGTTLRGLGDTLLYRITEAKYQEMMAASRRKTERQGAVEQNSVIYAQDRLGRIGLPNTMHGAAGDFSQDPYMARRFGPGEGRPVTMRSTFTEGDIRRGSIPGIPAPGTGR